MRHFSIKFFIFITSVLFMSMLKAETDETLKVIAVSGGYETQVERDMLADEQGNPMYRYWNRALLFVKYPIEAKDTMIPIYFPSSHVSSELPFEEQGSVLAFELPVELLHYPKSVSFRSLEDLENLTVLDDLPSRADEPERVVVKGRSIPQKYDTGDLVGWSFSEYVELRGRVKEFFKNKRFEENLPGTSKKNRFKSAAVVIEIYEPEEIKGSYEFLIPAGDAGLRHHLMSFDPALFEMEGSSIRFYLSKEFIETRLNGRGLLSVVELEAGELLESESKK